MSENRDQLHFELQRYRSYLLLLAQLQLESRVPQRIDASDIVQQTLLEAHLQHESFQGDEVRFMAWLRRVLANNLRDAWRGLRRAKRDVACEVSLEAALGQSSARLVDLLAADQTSPSHHASQHEELLRLADALAKLPTAQQEAIRLHHLQEWTLAEVARQMNRTEPAVAGLLHRGLKQLRRILEQGE